MSLSATIGVCPRRLPCLSTPDSNRGRRRLLLTALQPPLFV